MGDRPAANVASDDCCQHSAKAFQKDGADFNIPDGINNNNLVLDNGVMSSLHHREVTSSIFHHEVKPVSRQDDASSQLRQDGVTSSLRRRDLTSSTPHREVEPAPLHHDGTSSPEFRRKTEATTSTRREYKHHTLTSEEVHLVFREPFILTGYRPPYQPWRYYLFSLFWLHNETLNVWTHALGCLCLITHTLVLSSELEALGDPRAYTVLSFALGLFLATFFSSVAHLLHSKSPRLHCIFFLLDYAGVSFYNFSNAIGSMYLCSHPYTFAQLEGVFLPISFLLTWLSFVVISLVMLRFRGYREFERKVLMVSTFCVSFAFFAWPMSGRYWDCLMDAGCSLSSLNHITISTVTCFASAVCFTAHFPERRWPGTFDVWGHGHQWFHILVIVTQQLQLRAVHMDLVELEVGGHVMPGLPSLSHILLAFLLLAVFEGVTLWLLLPTIDRKVAMHADCRGGLDTAKQEDSNGLDQTKPGDTPGQ